MSAIPNPGRLVKTAILLALLSLLSMDRLLAEDGGRLVRSGAQGYSLRRPALARARRYDPEGILHVELADQQVLTVRVHDNPGRLPARAWADAWLARGVDTGDDLPEYAPRSRLLERRAMSVGNRPAESLILAGPAGRTRRTIFTTASRVYLIDYPLGHEANEPLFDHMLATFDTGTFAADSGVDVVERAASGAIPPLPVPLYSQIDPDWICDQLGTCTCDWDTCAAETYTGIGDAGCFMTAQSMVFQYYAPDELLDPKHYNICLTGAGGYGSSPFCDKGLCGALHNPPSPCRPETVQYMGISTDPNVLDNDLTLGRPPVALIDDGNHYVVIIGKTEGGNYIINEPWQDENMIREYISPGEIVHIVRYALAGAGPAGLGDVTGDGLVNSTDALVTLSADAGAGTSQFCPMNCGDVNVDGQVNSTDALIVLSHDAGLTVPFPVGTGACPATVTQPPGCAP